MGQKKSKNPAGITHEASKQFLAYNLSELESHLRVPIFQAWSIFYMNWDQNIDSLINFLIFQIAFGKI